jgi:catechol 2,3-dioxygenase-like lactoylglutathione lyase family enzyme
MLSGFDHVTIAVRDLQVASESYQRLLGAPPIWRGEHPELGTQAALFALRNALIELVGPRADAAEAEGLRALLSARGEGLQALALATLDAAGTSALFRERGLRATAPQAGEAHGPDGSVRAFRTVELSTRATRGLSIFAVERADLASLFVPAHEADHFGALDHVVIRTAQPDAAVQLYERGMGLRLALDRVVAGRRMLFFRIGGVTLEVVEDASAGEHDVFYGVAYRVRDLDAAHARLSRAGFLLGEPRPGNKPDTRVFTVRDGTHQVPTLVIHDPARDH